MPSARACRVSTFQRDVAATRQHHGTVAFDVEIFHDHRRIVDRHAIIRDQAGDLTKWAWRRRAIILA